MLKLRAEFGRKQDKFMTTDCVVEKIIELPEKEFACFLDNLAMPHSFIDENKDGLTYDADYVAHAMLVLGENHDDGVLVVTEGYDYARYTALLPHARDILAVQSLSPSLAELNRKLVELSDHAAAQCQSQLQQSGRVELSLNKMGWKHSIDLSGNPALWFTAVGIVTKQLGPQIETGLSEKGIVFIDPDIQKIIEICQKKIPYDPRVAASDQEWSITRAPDMDDLIECFQHGNWSARTGFVLDNLAFVEQVSGGNEWLTLRKDGEIWQSIDSISFYHMLQKNGREHCIEYIQGLQSPPVPEPSHDMNLEMG